MSDFIVRIEHKTKDGEVYLEQEYSFRDYTELVARELMGVLADIEAAFYVFEDGKPRDEWSKANLNRFNGIRHKMLDYANNVRRLPSELHHKGETASQESSGQFFARMIDNK